MEMLLYKHAVSVRNQDVLRLQGLREQAVTSDGLQMLGRATGMLLHLHPGTGVVTKPLHFHFPLWH